MRSVFLNWEGRSYQPDSYAADMKRIQELFPGPFYAVDEDVGMIFTPCLTPCTVTVISLRHGQFGKEEWDIVVESQALLYDNVQDFIEAMEEYESGTAYRDAALAVVGPR